MKAMSKVYFVVKIRLDQAGEPIKGSEEYVSVLTDGEAIMKAEAANKIHRTHRGTTNADIIQDATKRIRTTLSEFPAIRI
jgi:hypothetical protein